MQGHAAEKEGGTLVLEAREILRVDAKRPLPFPEMFIGFA